MKIAIRMDDITPTMDAEKFARFRQLCDTYGVKPLLGIVPDCRDPKLQISEANPQFYAMLKELSEDGYVLAQHGCTHVYRTKKGGLFPLNRNSETAGLSYAEQQTLLSEGQKKLKEHGIDTDIYMAPSHSYDKTTLRVLKELGFRYITDGFGKRPYIRSGLTFLPISFKQSRSLKQKDGYTTFVVHANGMKDSDFDRYERLFAEHAADIIPYSEYLAAKAAKRGFLGNACEYLTALCKFVLVRIRG